MTSHHGARGSKSNRCRTGTRRSSGRSTASTLHGDATLAGALPCDCPADRRPAVSAAAATSMRPGLRRRSPAHGQSATRWAARGPDGSGGPAVEVALDLSHSGRVVLRSAAPTFVPGSAPLDRRRGQALPGPRGAAARVGDPFAGSSRPATSSAPSAPATSEPAPRPGFVRRGHRWRRGAPRAAATAPSTPAPGEPAQAQRSPSAWVASRRERPRRSVSGGRAPRHG
mmetsp:Transcript_96455/g.269925  ORF Transcript_96455/g.269925 Transcript_96455/m.269925 type:complete len:227 (-) Transcript_96455:155-835(-)